MSRRGFSSIATLVEDLLARHERSPEARGLIAAIDDDGFANMDLRDAFDEALSDLERDGGVELIRKGPKTDRRVTGARLKSSEVLYGFVGRRPAVHVALQSVASLRSRPDLPHGAVDLIDAVAAAWGRGVSHIGVRPGEVSTLSDVIGLAIAVQSRLSGEFQADQDFRTFSRLSVADSKALERNLRSVAAALQRIYGADDRLIGMEPDEILATAGITRLPQPILVHGDVDLHGAPFPSMPYVGIPADIVGGLRLRSGPDYVLTIENFTSFVRYAREIARLDNALIIYAGGFPSRPALATIRRLAEQALAPTYHWGDMDSGGVRIFRHIERELAKGGVRLQPHMMDAQLLAAVGRPSDGATSAPGDVTGSAIAALAEALRTTGFVHEQEELDPRRPVVGGAAE
ncbi:hypothetical protein C100_14635 [Sphingobium sp. C100]|uniref:Wadjet anti-phage system protein JetD domain-containing protein n=1 Tax=Sphingobium sp. C100 TaxID=1207055 RepID=UPI0003D647E0|nr:Wadjet anti-phage system protein JetD domain-containing protein [Sphingobium sp. C100]ETI63086.1 hypothetical protein C100_14635 [Sphingobium sp. C100]